MPDALKSLISRFSLYLVGILWLLIANFFAFFAFFNEENIKSALVENDVYSKIVPSLLDNASYEQAEAGETQLPLKDPVVREAAKKAFPPGDVQAKSDTVISGVFNWLEGETETPQFELDFSNNKDMMAVEVSNNAQNRLAGLPACPRGQTVQSTAEFLTINCLPRGVNPAVVGATIRAHLLNDQALLEDTMITSEDLSLPNQQKTVFSAFEPIRGLYQLKPLLTWLLPALTALLAAVGVLASIDRPRSIRRLMRIGVSTGVLIGICLGILTLIFNVIKSNLSSPLQDSLTTTVLLPLIKSLAWEAQRVYIIFAVVSFAAAVGFYILIKRQRGL